VSDHSRVADAPAEPGLVEVTRAGWLESVHRVHVVVVDCDGTVLRSVGDPDRPASFRSVAKPLQALPLVEDGVWDHFGLDDRALALCCASHNSELRHVELARDILDRIGLDASALACGGHPPLRAAEAHRLAREGRSPGPLESNCSGKHAGMLALARFHGWDVDGYHRPDHPVQLRMRDEVARWTGVDADRLDTGIDGCGVVCFRVPLRHMAAAYARFAAAAAAGDPAKRVVGAMTSGPEWVGGEGRLDTALMRASAGRLLVKVGAEGVYAAAVPERGWGLAIEVEDGAWRASDTALVGALDRLGWPGARSADEGVAAFRDPVVRNTRGEAVGRICAGFDLEALPC
jgi:L-asparaginase II